MTLPSLQLARVTDVKENCMSSSDLTVWGCSSGLFAEVGLLSPRCVRLPGGKR